MYGDMDRGLVDVGSLLHCPMCKEGLTAPKVIPCKHVFCSTCLQELMQANNQLLCPVCLSGDTFNLYSGVADLPSPLSIRQLRMMVRKLLASYTDEGPVKVGCSVCKAPATHLCQTCGTLSGFCPHCKWKHLEEKAGHAVTLLSRWTFCEKHARAKALAQGYCKTCKTGLCGECMNNDHADHDVVANSDQSLIDYRRNELQKHRRYYQRDFDHFTSYKQKHSASINELNQKFAEAHAGLEDFRQKVNSSIDRLQVELNARREVERKRLEKHESLIEKIQLITESLLIYIDEIQKRDEPGDIDVTVDALKAINVNVCPTRPSSKHALVGGITNALESIEDIVRYVEFKPMHRREEGYQRVWSLPAEASSVCWDDTHPGWWVRLGDRLQRYDVLGNIQKTIKKGLFKQPGFICLDSKRGLLVTTDSKFTADSKVTTDGGNRILLIKRDGRFYSDILIPGHAYLSSVAYCPHKDIYVVVDKLKHCLWFVSADTRQVVSEIGSEGEENDQFNWPGVVCHPPAASPAACCVYVTDSGNHCVKQFTPTEFSLRKIGDRGLGSQANGGLHWPFGICADSLGQLFVCDVNNKRVVCFRAEEGASAEVLLDESHLMGWTPVFVGVSPDAKHLLVGIRSMATGGDVRIQGFTYS